MHQSSSFTSWGLDRNWKTGMQLVQVFCICTQSHHKVKLTAVFWRGVGSTQCLYNNGLLSLPSTPICNHRECDYLQYYICAFQWCCIYNIIFQGQSTQSPSSNFCNCVLFFQFYSIFFLHFFSFLKKGVIVMMMQQIGN